MKFVTHLYVKKNNIQHLKLLKKNINKMNLKNYKTGIIIQARIGSRRFPKKILASIYNKKIIEIMIERLLICFRPQDIYVATTNRAKDRVIISYLKKYKINFFQGSENNLLKRFIDCAKIHKLNKIIRLTADCPLIDPYLIKDFFINQLNKNLDYYSNCAPHKERSFPVGSDIEFFKVKTLKKIITAKPNRYENEHITPFIIKRKKQFKTFLVKSKKNNSDLRYTLDYREDLKVIRIILIIITKSKSFYDTILSDL